VLLRSIWVFNRFRIYRETLLRVFRVAASLDKIKRSTSRTFYYEKRLVTNWFHSKVLSNIS
ncbi:hypothetical protein P4S68_15060, partial [Pseudoalteromonas sp. Hal099]